jgi:FHS family glucose/mannose:H+ symporter-like MFS transporter
MPVSAIETPAPRLDFNTNLIVHAVFVPTGMVTVMLGPLLPLLAAKWSLDDSQAGYLITAQFIGSLLGTISSSVVLSRLGFRAAMIAGQLLMALGAATLLWNSFALGAASFFCCGFGIGLTIPTGNLAVAENAGRGRSSTLNLLNFCWSVGALSFPVLLAAVQKAYRPEYFLRTIAGMLLLLVLVVAMIPGEMSGPPQSEPSSSGKLSLSKYLRNPAAIMIGTLFFVYVGTESAIGAWLASYAKRAGDTAVAWITVPSFFYGALLLGRALAPVTLRRINDATQACLGVLLGTTACVLLILSHSTSGIATCAFLAGLGFSTLYPIAISFLSAAFGTEARRIGGVMFALSTLGGASVPWLVGFASTELNSLRSALTIPLAGCLIMLLLFSRPRWRELPA